ncbi:MAG: hypothetical protein ACRDSZ_13635 [Pseudonocardiaceae bacterium]
MVGGFAGQGRLGADAGEQVVGKKLREGFGELNVLNAAVTVQVERFEQALVDLSPDSGWCGRVVPVTAARHGQGAFELSGQVSEGRGGGCQFVFGVDLLPGQPRHFSFQHVERHGTCIVCSEQFGALVGECGDAPTCAGLVLFGLDLLGAEFGPHCAADSLDSLRAELKAAVEARDGRFDGVEADDGAAAWPPFGFAAEAQVVVVGAAVAPVAAEH